MNGTSNDNSTTTRTSNMNRTVVPVKLIQVVRDPVRTNNVKDDFHLEENTAMPTHDSNLWNTHFTPNVEAVNQFDIPKHIPTNVVQRALSQSVQISGGKIQHLHPDLVGQDAESVVSSGRQYHDGNCKTISSENFMPMDDDWDENVSSGAFVVCENEVHEIVSMQELEQHGDRNLINKEDISIPCPEAQSDNKLPLNTVHRKPTLDQYIHPVSAVSSLNLLKHDENWAVVSEFHSVAHEQNLPTVVDKAASLDKRILGVPENESCEKNMFAYKYYQNSPKKKKTKLPKQASTGRIWKFKEFCPLKANQLPKQRVLHSHSGRPRKRVSLTGQTSPGNICKGPSICQNVEINSDHKDIFYLQVPRYFSLVNTPVVSKETSIESVDRTIETEIHDPETADDDAEPELESIDDAHNKRRDLLQEMSVLLAKMQGDSSVDAKAVPSNTEEPQKQLPYKVGEFQDKIESVAVKQEPLDSDTSEHAEGLTASSASVNQDIKMVSIKQEPVSDDDLSYICGQPGVKLETLPGHVGCDVEQVDKLRVKEEVFEDTNQTVDTKAEHKPCKLDRGLFDLFSKEFPAQDRDCHVKNKKQKVVEVQVTCEGKLSKEDVCVPNTCTRDVQIPFDDLSKDRHSMCSMQNGLLKQCTKAEDGLHRVKPSDKTQTLNGQHDKGDKMTLTCKQRRVAKVCSAKRKCLAQERKSLAQERGKIAKKDGQVSRQIKELLQLCSEADEFSQQKGIGNEGCSKRKQRRLTKQKEPLHMSFGVTERREASDGGLVAATSQNRSDPNVAPGCTVHHQDQTNKKCSIDEKHEGVNSKPKSEPQINHPMSPVTNKKHSIDEKHESVKSKPKSEPQINHPASPVTNRKCALEKHEGVKSKPKRERQINCPVSSLTNKKCAIDEKHEGVKSKPKSERQINHPASPVTNKKCAVDEQHETTNMVNSKAKNEPQINQLVIRLENISEHPLVQDFVKREEEKKFTEASFRAQTTPDSKNTVGENSLTRKKVGRVSRQIQELLDICAEAEEFIDYDPPAEEITTGLFKRKSRRLSKQKRTLSSTSSPNSPKPNSGPVSCKEAKSIKQKDKNLPGIVDLEAKVDDDTVSQECRQGEDCPVRDKLSLVKKSQTSNYKLLIAITNKRKGEGKPSKNVKPTSKHKQKKVKVSDFSTITKDSRTLNTRSENNGNTEQDAISAEEHGSYECPKHSDYTQITGRMDKVAKDTIVSEDTSKPEVRHTAALVTEDGESEVSVLEDASLSVNDQHKIFYGSTERESPLYKNKTWSIQKTGIGDQAISGCNVNTVLSLKTPCNENTRLKTCVHRINNSVYSKYVNTMHAENTIRICEGKAVGDQVGLFAGHGRVCDLDSVEENVELVEDKRIVVEDKRVVYEAGVYMDNKFSTSETEVISDDDDDDVLCRSKDIVSAYDDISDDEVCVDEDLQMTIGLSGEKLTNISCSYEVISDDEYFKGNSGNSPILANGDSLYNDSKFKGTSPLQDQLGLDQRIVPKNLEKTVLNNKNVSCHTVLIKRSGSTMSDYVHPDKLKLDNMDYKCDICPWRCRNARNAVEHRLDHALHRLTINCQLSKASE